MVVIKCALQECDNSVILKTPWHKFCCHLHQKRDAARRYRKGMKLHEKRMKDNDRE